MCCAMHFAADEMNQFVYALFVFLVHALLFECTELVIMAVRGVGMKKETRCTYLRSVKDK